MSKVIKKSVPNFPIVREKGDDKSVGNEIVVENNQDNNQGGNNEGSTKLRGAKKRIKRNQPFQMNASDGSSKTEKTETKPDGSIVRTIVEINGNQKKTTVITTKGGSTSTNTRIETIGGGGGKSGGFQRDDSGFGFSGFGNSGFDDFTKMWNDQVNRMNNQMGNFYNGYSNFGNNGGGYYYEWNSGSNNNGGKNKGNYNQWNYEWDSNTGSGGKKNNNNNNKKKIQWDFDWGDNTNTNKNNNKNDGWSYEWGTDTNNNNKKNDGWNYEWGTDTNNNNKKNDKTTDYGYEKKKSTSIAGTEFQKTALEAHNKYRRKHHVGNLVLNEELCEIAQKYAEYMARTGNFAHSNGKYNGENMGENLFACYGMRITGDMMTDDWYDEVKQYDFSNPGFVNGTGHFTQVVWKESKEVGFGFAQAKDGYYYGVANYYPAGNYLGEFDSNVFEA